MQTSVYQIKPVKLALLNRRDDYKIYEYMLRKRRKKMEKKIKMHHSQR
jgi:hypothetical protein